MTFKALWVPVEKVQVKWKEKMIVDEPEFNYYACMHACKAISAMSNSLQPYGL